MQERHDNDEIESHNHNEYPLLYKEAEISTSSLGKFLECWKCYILLVTCALMIYLICMPSALSPRALGIHIRQIPRAHVTTITYNLDNIFSMFFECILLQCSCSAMLTLLLTCACKNN